MSKAIRVWVSFSCLAIGTAPSMARAEDYYSYNAPVDPVTKLPDESKEINASQGGLNAFPLVAAGRMGLMFYKGNAITEPDLLAQCKLYSPPGTTWMDGCDIGGLTVGMGKSFAFNNWVVLKESTQSVALEGLIVGLRDHASPVLAPLYGHATHWAAIYMVSVTGSTLQGVEWFDSGPKGQKDGQNTYYDDGVQGADGTTFQATFYKLINSSYISATDPYKSKYIVAYDPPASMAAGYEIQRPSQARPMTFERSQGVIGPEERMTADIARDRVWDALWLSSIPRSPVIWPAIERGMPGAAWMVRSLTPQGAGWDYYVVPLLDEDGLMIGLVQLSAEDGGFQQVWAPREPSLFLGITPEEASRIADSMRHDGEHLVVNGLTWDPTIEEPLAPSPMFPYYEFHIRSKEGGDCGTLRVMLKDGQVSIGPSGSEVDCALR